MARAGRRRGRGATARPGQSRAAPAGPQRKWRSRAARGLRDGRAVPWPCAARTDVRGAGPPKRRRAGTRAASSAAAQRAFASRRRSGSAAPADPKSSRILSLDDHRARPKGDRGRRPWRAAGAAACGRGRRGGHGPCHFPSGASRRSPEPGPSRRRAKIRAQRAPARPSGKRRDLWRRPPPPVCAHSSRAHQPGGNPARPECRRHALPDRLPALPIREGFGQQPLVDRRNQRRSAAWFTLCR